MKNDDLRTHLVQWELFDRTVSVVDVCPFALFNAKLLVCHGLVNVIVVNTMNWLNRSLLALFVQLK